MDYQKFDELREGNIETIAQLRAYCNRLEPHIELETMTRADFDNISEGFKLLNGYLDVLPANSTVPELAKNIGMIIETACSRAYDKFCIIQRQNSLNLAPRPRYC